MAEVKKYIDDELKSKWANKGLYLLNVMLYWCFFASVWGFFLIKKLFGNIDLSAIPFMMARLYGGGMNVWIELKILGIILLPSLFLVLLVIGGVRKFYKYSEMEIKPLGLAVYLVLLLGVIVGFVKDLVGFGEILFLFIVFVGGYLWLSKRNFSLGWLLGLVMFFYAGLCYVGVERYGVFEFFKHSLMEYEVIDTKNLVMKNKRNVIVVFAESLENRYAEVDFRGKKLKINDNDAIKFSDFREGKLQGDTLHALGAFLQGVQLEYLENMKKTIKGKEELKKAKGESVEEVIDVENLGVSNVLKSNGYRNLFVKGADLGFVKTDDFLLSQGFLKDEMFGLHSFPYWEEYLKSLGKKGWWAPKDRDVFSLFKEKILEIEKDKPFFAVMFTADWHAVIMGEWKNPFYETDKDIQIGMIEAINDFIDWYKVQDFYENTTLIVVGDHRKMGVSERRDDEKLYNAFFNLPDELKKNLELKRVFNQIDLAPSVLEIAGVELKNRKYGLGVSVFSKNKTMAEEFNILQ